MPIRTATAADLFGKKPATTVHYVVLDPALAQQWEEAVQERDTAQKLTAVSTEQVGSVAERLRKAEKRLDKLRTEVAEHTVAVRLRAMSRPTWDALISEHPPTEAQIEQWEKDGAIAIWRPMWNEETFSPALLALCAVDDDGHELMPVDKWQDIWKSEEWSAAELNGLSRAAVNINNLTRVPDLGKGFDLTES